MFVPAHNKHCINRIRLEFKDIRLEQSDEPERSINRIRLEFKVYRSGSGIQASTVLIESDWNLKWHKEANMEYVQLTY